jgi:hypothetical protein
MKKFLLSFLLLFVGLISFAQHTQTAKKYYSSYYKKNKEYYLYLPSDYPTATKKPLLIFLHGTGEVGDSIHKILVTGTPPKLIQEGLARVDKNINGFSNFIVVSPQSPTAYWQPGYVEDLMKHLIATYKIDTTKIYLTGLSSGGKGVLNYAMYYPHRPTALLAIAAPNATTEICAAKNVPLWSFQGGLDHKGPTGWTNTYNNCIPAPPIKASLTIINGAGHNSGLWGTVYKCNPIAPDGSATGLKKDTIFNWFLQYSKKTEVVPEPNNPPTLELGENINLTKGDQPLSATVSSNATDSDGFIETYKWEQLSGQSLIFNSSLSYLSVSNLNEGMYQFKLTVTDNKGLSVSDDIYINVKKPRLLYRINSGGGEIVDSIMNWSKDTQLAPSSYVDLSTSNNYTTGSLTWTGVNHTKAPNNVFGNNRYSTTKNINYKFPVIDGKYIVKLYFNDKSTTTGARVFNVVLEGNTVLENFDIYQNFGEATGQKDFNCLVTDSELNLNFIPIVSRSRIDAIEIYSVE